MAASSSRIMIRGYAKINLGLRVLRKRPDGYHDIETVLHRIHLFDEITLRPAPEIRVDSTDPTAPGDPSNTCYRAAMVFKEHFGVQEGVHCRVSKRIPVGAGLGGGSSDAASVLRALPGLWGVPAGERLLRELALRVGADVPYFLGEGTAVAQGRGEQLQHFRFDVPYAICVCYPNIHVSTAWAYARVTARERTDGSLRAAVTEGMTDHALLAEALANDFEPVVTAEYPEVAELKHAFLARGAVAAAMSGSGSSVYGLFRDSDAAEGIAREFRAKGYRAFETPPHFVP
ncbi:MAG: 4-(cytidine 5'-diphospho)-2-C-methyl-D-erythritol kinase [Bacteroidota bacterium]